LKHTGRAIVFNNFDKMNARIDDPALDADANMCSVRETRGPKGAPGMPNGKPAYSAKTPEGRNATWCAFPMRG